MSTQFREARIEPSAITENVRQLRKLVETDVIAVVKADGYGHGAVTAGRAALAGGAIRLGAADLGEALKLRSAGITEPLMAWLHTPGEDFVEAIEQGIEIGISRFEQLEAVASAARGRRVAGVHLKLDTGLSRNGIAPYDWSAVFAEAARLESAGVVKVVGIMCHLSNTSVADDEEAFERYQAGVKLAGELGVVPEIRHVAATEAALTHPEMRLDAVRTGIGIYGLSPITGRLASEWGLRPAMSLRSRVAAVRRVSAGTGVSYGYDFRASTDTTLALVPLGYADGIPRQASGKAEVCIGGVRMPVAGRIAMDQFVVDAGEHAVSVGDEVVVFGDPAEGVPSADQWAEAAGTINYDIVTGIGARVPRTS